jgi:hypothetical protein
MAVMLLARGKRREPVGRPELAPRAAPRGGRAEVRGGAWRGAAGQRCDSVPAFGSPVMGKNAPSRIAAATPFLPCAPAAACAPWRRPSA